MNVRIQLDGSSSGLMEGVKTITHKGHKTTLKSNTGQRLTFPSESIISVNFSDSDIIIPEEK